MPLITIPPAAQSSSIGTAPSDVTDGCTKEGGPLFSERYPFRPTDLMLYFAAYSKIHNHIFPDQDFFEKQKKIKNTVHDS
jgi:hypothetical protein